MHFQIALELNSDYAAAHDNLGNIYDDKGKFDKAIEQYQIALKLKPDDALTHFNLGIAFRRKGLKSEAIKEFQTALNIKSDFTEARQALEFIKK